MIIDWRSGFVLHPERSGRISVRLRITVRGRRPVDISTGCRLTSREDWDKKHGRVVVTARNAQASNSRLADAEAAVTALFARYSLVEKRVPTRDEVVNGMNEALGRTVERKDTESVPAVVDMFVSATGGAWAYSTHQKFRTMKAHLKEYRHTAVMGDIDTAYLNGFVDWLIRDKKLRNTSAAKMAGFVRWFLRWAEKERLYTGGAHRGWKPRLKGSNFEYKEVVYLTADELRAVESHVFKSASLSQVRDVFVFCCYSGLRFSDAAKLRKDDIKDGCIEIVTTKTSERLRIELNSHTREILERYADKPIPDGRALPAISNQRTNEYLRDVGRECGIDSPVTVVYYRGGERVEEVRKKYELLTTHAARRTFVVTALSLGIPVEVIIRWTGHSDYKAMKPYIAIVDTLRKDSMAKFDTITARNKCATENDVERYSRRSATLPKTRGKRKKWKRGRPCGNEQEHAL